MQRLNLLFALTLLAPLTLAGEPDLGPNASLHGKRVLPPDNLWNKDISKSPIDPRSDAIVAGIGLDKPLHPDFGLHDGIPYIVVDGKEPKTPIHFTAWPAESDPGPYPIPTTAPIEGGPDSKGDRHVLALDRDHWILYELDNAVPTKDGWDANCGAIFDLKTNKTRPTGWTSADAAGLPIFPGLVRYDEVIEQKAINHAIRFTVNHSRRAFIPPALHYASQNNNPNLPPMGMRVRLKSTVDITNYPPEVQVILTALKRYGMILADNGSDWFISGCPDPRWSDDTLGEMKKIHGKDFEVIKMDDAAR